MDARQAQFDYIKQQMQTLLNQLATTLQKKDVNACLESLIYAASITIDQKLQLLKEVVSPETNENFAMLLASFQGSADISYYLDFLITASQSNATEVMSLLEQKTKGGWTFPMCVAHYGYSGDSNLYLYLLGCLLNKGIPANRLLQLEMSAAAVVPGQPDESYHERYCDKLMRKQKHSVGIAYIAWLNRLLEAGVSPKAIYDLLVTNGIFKNSYHLHATIQSHQSKATKQAFNQFLAKIVYTILKTQELSPEHYQHLAFLKEAMYEYISTLPERERLAACQAGIDSSKPLGKLFWLKRGRSEPKLDSGMLGKLSADIVEIERNKAKTLDDFRIKIQTSKKVHKPQRYSDILHEIMASTLPAEQKIGALSYTLNYPPDVMNDFRQESNIGMLVANYQHLKDDLNQYLTFLGDLISQNGPMRITELLEQTNAENYHLGICLSRFQDAKLFEQYLDVLTKLVDWGLAPIVNLHNILQPRTLATGEVISLGGMLANLNSAVCMNKYFNILSKLLRGRLIRDEHFKEYLSALHGVNRWNTSAMSVSAEMADKCPSGMLFYLSMLTDSLHAEFGLTAKTIYELISVFPSKAFGGPDRAHLYAKTLAEKHDVATIRQYLQLLVSLGDKGIDAKDISKLLTAHAGNSGSESFVSIMIKKHSGLLYELINTGLLLMDEEYTEFRGQKDLILAQIKSLPESEKQQALAHALDRGHPVGKLFWLGRDIKKDDNADPHLLQIKAELTNMQEQHVAGSVQESQLQLAKIELSGTPTDVAESCYPLLSADDENPAVVIPSAPPLDHPAEEMHIDTPGAEKLMLKSMPLSLLDGSRLSMPLATQPDNTDLISFNDDVALVSKVADLIGLGSPPVPTLPAQPQSSYQSILLSLNFTSSEREQNQAAAPQAPANNDGAENVAVSQATQTRLPSQKEMPATIIIQPQRGKPGATPLAKRTPAKPSEKKEEKRMAQPAM